MIYELLIRNFEVALKSDCTDDSIWAFRLLRARAYRGSEGIRSAKIGSNCLSNLQSHYYAGPMFY